MAEEYNHKPPLGVVPKRLWLDDRIDELVAAMERYRKKGYVIPLEFAEELVEHLRTVHG